MVVVCEVCGSSFEKPGHRVNRSKTGKHYCSKECYNKNPIITQELTGMEVSCKCCGQVFYRSKSYLDRSKSGYWFCSKSCKASYYSDKTQSIHNAVCTNCGKSFHTSPSKLGGNLYCSRECWKSYIQSSGPSYYRKFKGDSCSICGFIPQNSCQLDVHHSDGCRGNNNKDNLITVCANCHRLLHREANTLGPNGNKRA